MKKTLKRLCTGFLALATVVTALPTTLVHAESKQYWTESKERVGIVEKVMNDGSIGSTFNEGHLTVEGEDAYCIDINTDFKNGYKTRADASSRMSADQISDVALSIEYTNAVLYILDPKNADLADLGTVMENVYHTKEEMIDCVNAFYEGMVQRSEEMKRHPNYKTGENYAYLGLPPCFLIFDEYVAFFEMLGTKESVSLLSQLKKIVMLGRQAGYFLIVACQRPDAKYFSDGIRDNFNFRVGLGRISELGYGMLFGSDVKKQFFQKRIKGRGYCDVGTSVISEFYTPLVPKGHDFLQTIGSLVQARQDGTATCEAKGDGSD